MSGQRSVENTSDFGYTKPREVLECVIVKSRHSSWIRLVTRWDKDDHPLARARQ